MIRFDAVSFDYISGGVRRRALDDVSLCLEPGRMVAVLGANGSGKSTLVKLANGLALPFAGTVSVEGMDTRDASLWRSIRQMVGTVFQHPDDQIVATTVEDDVAFGPENLGVTRSEIRERVDAAIAAVGLDGLEQREPHLLSGGQKQRLAIAGALALRPRYLVLDEPTSMLDPVGRREVLAAVESLRRSGHAVLLVTHDLSEAMLADDVIVLAGGRIAWSGRPEGLLEQWDRFSTWALEEPPLLRLVRALNERGVGAPIGDVEELEGFLWR